MKLRQEARVLKEKAISSMIAATEAFNSPHDRGRDQRSPEPAALLRDAAQGRACPKGVSVFDPTLGRSLGFETCVRKAAEHPAIKLSESDAGSLRAIDAMRDDEQHWFNQVSEQLLYVHARAGVTLFDDLLLRMFKERLADHLPSRVLPVSVDPPRDLALLLDEEYTQIAALLQPGRRATHEARARIRTLLAMEAHAGPETRVSSKDVNRVQDGIRRGETRAEVFPRLQDLATSMDGDGLLVTLRFVKNQAAPPVRYVADETVPAAAIREVDLQAKFRHSPADLAKDLGLTQPRSTALRRHLASVFR